MVVGGLLCLSAVEASAVGSGTFGLFVSLKCMQTVLLEITHQHVLLTVMLYCVLSRCPAGISLDAWHSQSS